MNVFPASCPKSDEERRALGKDLTRTGVGTVLVGTGSALLWPFGGLVTLLGAMGLVLASLFLARLYLDGMSYLSYGRQGAAWLAVELGAPFMACIALSGYFVWDFQSLLTALYALEPTLFRGLQILVIGGLAYAAAANFAYWGSPGRSLLWALAILFLMTLLAHHGLFFADSGFSDALAGQPAGETEFQYARRTSRAAATFLLLTLTTWTAIAAAFVRSDDWARMVQRAGGRG